MASWTAPSDHSATPLSTTEWNNLLGTSGSVAYLKEACDANAASILVPMKAQGDGGTVHGGRNKLNFVAGANMVVTVADDAGNDRINVTLAASGASVPTLGTDVSGSVVFTAPASFPNWCDWVTAIASPVAESLAVLIAFNGASGTNITIQLGTGTPVTEKLTIPVLGTYIYHEVIPFRFAQGVPISARVYYLSSVSGRSLSMTLLT